MIGFEPSTGAEEWDMQTGLCQSDPTVEMGMRSVPPKPWPFRVLFGSGEGRLMLEMARSEQLHLRVPRPHLFDDYNFVVYFIISSLFFYTISWLFILG